MSRIDQDSSPVINLTPTPDEITPGVPVVEDQPPIRSASQYTQRVKTRRAKTENLKGRGKPLGGAPPIPEGKLAALASHQEVTVPDERPPPINSTEAEAVKASQNHIPGVGAAYEVNQAMARGDTDKQPISMGEAKRRGMGGRAKAMSPETLEALGHVKEQYDEQARDAAEETGELEAGLDKVEEDISQENMPFDFEALMAAKNVLLNKDRRKIIEGHLEELDIGDLIMKKEIQQQVDILPEKFWLTLRTFTQKEHLFCLRKVNEYTGSPMYLEELLNTFKLVCSLVSVNSQMVPEHRADVGTRNENVDNDAFDLKMFTVSMYPVHVLADLSVQMNWFNERVTDLFQLDTLKNG